MPGDSDTLTLEDLEEAADLLKDISADFDIKTIPPMPPIQMRASDLADSIRRDMMQNMMFTTAGLRSMRPSKADVGTILGFGEENMAKKGMTDRKEQILGAVEDLVANFLFYDRKEDEDLPEGTIESYVEYGNISVDDIVEQFRTSLLEGLDNN